MKKLDLGLIGNSRTSALIDRQARIVWWCYPHFDSNPMCCSLLRPVPSDAAPETFGFTDVLFPDSHTVRQVYQRNSAILQTRMEDGAGNLIDIIDFAPRFYRHGRMFAPAMLVRIIKRVSGTYPVSEAVSAYGKLGATVNRYDDAGDKHTKLRPLIGAGLGYKFTKEWSAGVEYVYFGEYLDLKMSMWSANLRYHF